MIFGVAGLSESIRLISGQNSDFADLRANPLAGIPFRVQRDWSSEQIVLLEQSLQHDEAEQELSSVFSHNGYRVICWARVDNQQELIDKLPVQYHELADSTQGLLLACYLHWGKHCCTHLVGDFVFAIYDPQRNALFLGRDHFGVKPLYYYQHDGVLVFASSLAVFHELSGLDMSLNRSWLARYLIGRSADWQQTPYRHIVKLPPAHSLLLSLDPPGFDKVELDQYFEFSKAGDVDGTTPEEDCVERYRQCLSEAVSCRVPEQGVVGAELSGGLDSSSVAALASRNMRQPARQLHCFGLANQPLVAEAMAAVAQTSRVAMCHFVTRTHNNRMTEELFNSTVAAPLEIGSSLGHYPIYQQCQQQGIQVLLSGFGGDELVTNMASVALTELYKGRRWREFYARQRGNFLSRPLHTLRWLWRYHSSKNSSSTAESLQSQAEQTWSMQFVGSDAAEQFELKDSFYKRMRYDAGWSTLNEFLIGDRWSPELTARLENCTLAAARFGVEYRWPLLDIRLVQLYLSMPTTQKFGPAGVGRYLHRRAVSSILPRHIAWGPKDLIKVSWFRSLFSNVYRQRYSGTNSLLAVDEKISMKSERFFAATANVVANVGGAKQAQENEIHPELVELVDQSKITRAADAIASEKDPAKQVAWNIAMISYTRLNHWLKTQVKRT